MDRFKDHRFFTRAKVADNVFDLYTNLFLKEAGISSLPYSDSSALTLFKRCCHGEVGLLISDLDKTMINLDGFNSPHARTIMNQCRITSKFLPDILVSGPPRMIGPNGPVPVNVPPVGRVDESKVVGGKSWYTLEVSTTRVSPLARIEQKITKGYDYYFIVYWNEGSPDFQLPHGWFKERWEHCTFYTNITINRKIRKAINDRMQRFKYGLYDIDARRESALSRLPIDVEMRPFTRDYYVDSFHMDDKPFFAEMEHEAPLDREEFFENTYQCCEMSEKPAVIQIRPEPDPVNETFKEEYARTPVNMVFPIYEINDQWLPLADMEYRGVIRPGSHFAIKKSAFPKKMAAHTYWAFINHAITTYKFTEDLKDLQYGVHVDLNKEAHWYGIFKFKNSLFNCSGFKSIENKRMDLADAKLLDMKKSDIGQSVLLRCIMDHDEEIDHKSIKKILPQVLTEAHKDENYRIAIWYEEFINSKAWTVRLKASSIAARRAVTALGRWKEKNKSDREITYKIIPYRVGVAQMGYWFVANGHVRDGHQKAVVHCFFYAFDDCYVAAQDYTIFKCTNPFMKYHGFTCIYAKLFPISKNKLLNIREAGVRGLITGAAHIGDWLKQAARDSYHYDPTRDARSVFKNYARETLLMILDNNAIQGKSRSLTKLRMQQWAADMGLVGYSMAAGWWDDILDPEQGVAHEFERISLTAYAEKIGANLDDQRKSWSWKPAARLKCIRSEDMHVITEQGIRLGAYFHGKYQQFGCDLDQGGVGKRDAAYIGVDSDDEDL